MSEIPIDLCEKYPNFAEIDPGYFLGYYETNKVSKSDAISKKTLNA